MVEQPICSDVQQPLHLRDPLAPDAEPKDAVGAPAMVAVVALGRVMRGRAVQRGPGVRADLAVHQQVVARLEAAHRQVRAVVVEPVRPDVQQSLHLGHRAAP